MNRVYSYTAGLFDGEGCITLFYDRKAEFPTVRVSITNTNYCLIDFLHNTFNGYVTKRKKEKSTYKQSWNWYIGNIDKIIKFLEHIYPFLKESEKIRKARLIIEDYRYSIKKGQYLTKEDKLNNKAFYEEFHKNR